MYNKQNINNKKTKCYITFPHPLPSITTVAVKGIICTLYITQIMIAEQWGNLPGKESTGSWAHCQTGIFPVNEPQPHWKQTLINRFQEKRVDCLLKCKRKHTKQQQSLEMLECARNFFKNRYTLSYILTFCYSIMFDYVKYTKRENATGVTRREREREIRREKITILIIKFLFYLFCIDASVRLYVCIYFSLFFPCADVLCVQAQYKHFQKR